MLKKLRDYRILGFFCSCMTDWLRLLRTLTRSAAIASYSAAALKKNITWTVNVQTSFFAIWYAKNENLLTFLQLYLGIWVHCSRGTFPHCLIGAWRHWKITEINKSINNIIMSQSFLILHFRKYQKWNNNNKKE